MYDKEHQVNTRLVILDAVAAEIIWGIGEGYDYDVIISRHADNVANYVGQILEHEAAKADKKTT